MLVIPNRMAIGARSAIGDRAPTAFGRVDSADVALEPGSARCHRGIVNGSDVADGLNTARCAPGGGRQRRHYRPNAGQGTKDRRTAPRSSRERRSALRRVCQRYAGQGRSYEGALATRRHLGLVDHGSARRRTGGIHRGTRILRGR